MVDPSSQVTLDLVDLVRWMLNIQHCPMNGSLEKETRSLTIYATTELHVLPSVNHH